MGQPRPVPGNTAATLNSINALCDTVDAVLVTLQTLQDGENTLGGIIGALQSSVTTQLYAVTSNLSSLQNSFNYQNGETLKSINSLSAASQFLQGLIFDLQHIVGGFQSEVTIQNGKFQAAIDANAAQIIAVRDQLKGLVADLSKFCSDQFAALATLANRFSLHHRPGDAPGAFAVVMSPYALSGSRDNLPTIPPAMIVGGPTGSALRLTGQSVVGMADPVAIETGRAYRLRAAVQRLSDPTDPNNDTVQIGLIFLDAALSPMPKGQMIIEELTALRSSTGRVEVQTVLGRAAGDQIQIVAPLRARYVRAWMRTFGSDGVTLIDVLGISDVTDAVLLDPVSANLVSQVAALASVNAGPRLDVIEQSLAGPNTLTLKSKSEASRTTPAGTVTTIRLLGGTVPGDGRDGLYRPVGVLPDGADGFTCADGSAWQRVFPADDLVSSQTSDWYGRLPTSPPAGANQPWLNGGLLSWTPGASS